MRLFETIHFKFRQDFMIRSPWNSFWSIFNYQANQKHVDVGSLTKLFIHVTAWDRWYLETPGHLGYCCTSAWGIMDKELHTCETAICNYPSMPSINGDLGKLQLTLWHGRVSTYHIKPWVWLVIDVPIRDWPGALCDMGYTFEMHPIRKSRWISFAHRSCISWLNVLKFCRVRQ